MTNVGTLGGSVQCCQMLERPRQRHVGSSTLLKTLSGMRLFGLNRREWSTSARSGTASDSSYATGVNDDGLVIGFSWEAAGTYDSRVRGTRADS